MTQPVVLSASSVTTFLRCGQQWWFAYVAGVKSPPSLRAIRGIAVHKAVETDMRQKLDTWTDLPVEDMLDSYDTSWTEETADGFDKSDEPEGVVKDKGYELVKLYHEQVAPTIQPALVEAAIQFDINGQPYSGQLDLARYVTVENWDGPEERLEIRDTKTTARTPSGDSYLLNMTGYAIGLRQQTGTIETDIVFDYLIAKKESTYKELRMGGPITDDQIGRFSSIVGSVSAAIEAGRFVPNGLLSNACGWCGYRTICPSYLKSDIR